MNTVTIRRATQADVSTVVDIWTEASEWLRQRGSDQWQYPIRMDNVRNAIAGRACWIIERPVGGPVGIVTVDEQADPELWEPTDQPDRALYLYGLVVRLDCRTQHLGAAILDWASLRAQTLGKIWLRLDAWTSNEQLHQYCLNRGFRQVRTVDGPGVVSGVLFERPAGKVEGLGPIIVEPAEPGGRR